jgi:hypothetical protein
MLLNATKQHVSLHVVLWCIYAATLLMASSVATECNMPAVYWTKERLSVGRPIQPARCLASPDAWGVLSRQPIGNKLVAGRAWLRDVVAGLTDQRRQVSRSRRRVYGRRPRDACGARLLPGPEDAEGVGCGCGVVVWWWKRWCRPRCTSRWDALPPSPDRSPPFAQHKLATQPPPSRLPAFVCTPAARQSDTNTHAHLSTRPATARHGTAYDRPHATRRPTSHSTGPSCQATADCHGAARRPHSPHPPDILLRLSQRLLSLSAAPLMEACARYQT